MRTTAAVLLAACLSLPAFADDKMHPPQDTSALEPVKQLAGTWEHYDEKGKMIAVSEFRVTSGGNAVREILFPGQPHEMTNMYHMDKGALVMTHYCAGGTQARMKAPGLKDGRIVYAADSVSNLTVPGQSYMGEMTLVLKDQDTVQQEWTSIEGAKRSTKTFTMKRKAT